MSLDCFSDALNLWLALDSEEELAILDEELPPDRVKQTCPSPVPVLELLALTGHSPSVVRRADAVARALGVERARGAVVCCPALSLAAPRALGPLVYLGVFAVSDELEPGDHELALLAVPALRALLQGESAGSSLVLSYPYLTEETFEALAQSDGLRSLESLELHCCCSARALGALARAPNARALRSLTVRLESFTSEWLGALSRTASLESLELLELELVTLEREGVEALREAPWLRSLRSLSLRCCPDKSAPDACAELLFALSDAAPLALESLTLELPVAPEDGVARLAQSEALRSVRRLTLLGPAGDGVARELAFARCAPSLEALELGNGFTADAVAYFARGEGLPALRELLLRGSFELEAFARVERSPRLRGLERLRLLNG